LIGTMCKPTLRPWADSPFGANRGERNAPALPDPDAILTDRT
jgi:hypothetical protein